MARAGRALRRADDDGAWKRLLTELLAEFVAFALPDLHPEVDWSREPVFLEQELRPLLRQAALNRRVGDIVAQVWLKSGAVQWLLVHVEIQDRHEADFAERMYLYAAMLHMHYRTRRLRQASDLLGDATLPSGMLGIAVLTDADDSWQPDIFRWGWGDDGIQYRYRTLKLAEWRARVDELADDARPFSWVVRTWLAVQAAGQTIAAQSAARRAIGRQLLAARRQGRLSADQTLAIYIFLDAVNRLPDMFADTIDRELQLTEEAPMAELLTRWERKGQTEGMSEVILLQLEQKAIAIDTTTETHIRSLDRNTLARLAKAVLDLQTRGDLDIWLTQHGPQGA